MDNITKFIKNNKMKLNTEVKKHNEIFNLSPKNENEVVKILELSIKKIMGDFKKKIDSDPELADSKMNDHVNSLIANIIKYSYEKLLKKNNISFEKIAYMIFLSGVFITKIQQDYSSFDVDENKIIKGYQ